LGVSSRGLNTSAFALVLTPQLYQTGLLPMPSREPRFGGGFGLRCFQPLSAGA